MGKNIVGFLLDLPSLSMSKQVSLPHSIMSNLSLYPSLCQIMCPRSRVNLGSSRVNLGSLAKSMPDHVPDTMSNLGLYPIPCQNLCPKYDLFVLRFDCLCCVDVKSQMSLPSSAKSESKKENLRKFPSFKKENLRIDVSSSVKSESASVLMTCSPSLKD